jgi:hypothetical protein
MEWPTEGVKFRFCTDQRMTVAAARRLVSTAAGGSHAIMVRGAHEPQTYIIGCWGDGEKVAQSLRAYPTIFRDVRVERRQFVP